MPMDVQSVSKYIFSLFVADGWAAVSLLIIFFPFVSAIWLNFGIRFYIAMETGLK
jgi:hypothetical protein